MAFVAPQALTASLFSRTCATPLSLSLHLSSSSFTSIAREQRLSHHAPAATPAAAAPRRHVPVAAAAVEPPLPSGTTTQSGDGTVGLGATGSKATTQSETEPETEAESTNTTHSDGVPFPQLYDAWFGPRHELATQMQEAVSRAYDAGVRDMELQWPVVPNLEEIAAGTLLNMRFGQQVAEDLGMSTVGDYQLVKRYLSSFCNVWWVLKLAEAEAFKRANKTIWVVSTDPISKAAAAQTLARHNVKLASMGNPPETQPGDVVVIIDPRFDDMWKRGMRMKAESDDSVIVFLNSQFNESYGLTGPRWRMLKSVTPVYFVKRVTRGFAFFSYPGPWRACLERPDLAIETLREFEREPRLREIANVVRNESNRRYGGLHNDRYVQGFGGRL